METKKIAIACFLGAMICTAIALAFTPQYWWLGLLSGVAAGFITGYVSYDVKDVVLAMPRAWRQTVRHCRNGWYGSGRLIVKTALFLRGLAEAFWWLVSRRHPFLHLPMLAGITCMVLMFICFPVDPSDPDIGTVIGVLTMFNFCILLIALQLLFSLSNEALERKKQKFWVPSLWEVFDDQDSMINREVEKGLSPQKPGYFSVMHYFSIGVLHSIKPYLKIAVKVILSPLYFVFYLVPVFVCKLFLLVHSRARLLCAIDGTLGGTIAAIYFRSVAFGSAEYIVAICFGGILGTAWGILNWEIISKRILKIPAAINTN